EALIDKINDKKKRGDNRERHLPRCIMFKTTK
ncbi:unnamed protein product, partial [Adineta steineri]